MRVGPGGGCLGLCRVNVQSKDVLECDDKGSFCVIPSTEEGEYVPPVQLSSKTQYVNGFLLLWPWCHCAPPVTCGGRSLLVRRLTGMRESSSGIIRFRLATVTRGTGCRVGAVLSYVMNSDKFCCVTCAGMNLWVNGNQ